MALTRKLSRFLNLRRKIGMSSTTVILDAVVVIESGMEYEEKVSEVRRYPKVRPTTLRRQGAKARISVIQRPMPTCFFHPIEAQTSTSSN